MRNIYKKTKETDKEQEEIFKKYEQIFDKSPPKIKLPEVKFTKNKPYLKNIFSIYVPFAFFLVISINLLNVTTSYRDEIKKQEQKMIYEKKNPIGITTYQEGNSEKTFGVSKIENKILCYKNTDFNEIKNTKVEEYITQLNKLYQSNYNYFSFLYQDLYSGYTVSYNEEAPIFTASTIKAPAVIYIYEEASLGKVDLNEKLKYTSNFYNTGSGVLKTKQPGTEYTIEELIQYTIHDSDNAAYDMLMNRFGRKNVLNYWQNLGTKNIFTIDTIWGVITARDAAIYMKELYRFSRENEKYGQRLINYFKEAEWKLITNKDGVFNTANKGGWSDETMHDVSIVYEENPYLLIILSNTGNSDYQYLFQTTSKLVGQLHEEYWKYKEEKCNQL